MEKAIPRGDILRTSYEENALPLYMGSGNMGACFNAYGLMNATDGPCKTVIMHSDIWYHGIYDMDFWAPVARVCFKELPKVPQTYRQHLSLYDGILKSDAGWDGASLTVRTAMNPAKKDILVLEVAYENAAFFPTIEILIDKERTNCYGETVEASFKADASTKDLHALHITCGSSSSVLLAKVSGDAALSPSLGGLALSLTKPEGKFTLFVALGAEKRKEAITLSLQQAEEEADYFATVRESWHKRWGTSFLDMEDDFSQKMWARSMFYMLSTFSEEAHAPAPPCGWTGNGWQFGFPQDIMFLHGALLRFGHFDLAKSIVEYYRAHLDGVYAFTKRIFGKEGTMYPWEFPMGDAEKHMASGAPDQYQFQIHNAASPAKMAADTALFLKDDQWTRENLYPILEGSARFYLDCLKKGSDGLWEIHVTPSMGQDEFGGVNQKNYFCALTSAKSVLTMCVRWLREEPAYRELVTACKNVLSDGLAFPRLLTPEGLYRTCETVDGSSAIGKEKHPTQLSQTAMFTDLYPQDETLRRQYENRYAFCQKYLDERTAFGWTVQFYCLASARLGEKEEFLKDLSLYHGCDLLDPEEIQIYESSRYLNYAYFMTAQGMMAQCFADAVVNDFYGETTIGKGIPESFGTVRYRDIHSRDGKAYSGNLSPRP